MDNIHNAAWYFLSGNDDNINQTIDLEFSVDENPQNDQIIGYIQSDEIQGNPTFSINSQNPEGAILIEENTGEIRVADRSQFDFETHNQISAIVNVTNDSDTRTFNVTIIINDIIDQQMRLDNIERFDRGSHVNFDYENGKLIKYNRGVRNSGCTTELQYENDQVVFVDYNCGGAPGWGVYTDLWITYDSNNRISAIETKSKNTDLIETFIQYFTLQWSGNRLELRETISGRLWLVDFDENFRIQSYIHNGIESSYSYVNGNLISVTSSNGSSANYQYDTSINPLSHPLHTDMVLFDFLTYFSWGDYVNTNIYIPDSELTNTNNFTYTQRNNSFPRYYEYEYNPNNYPVVQLERGLVKFREYHYTE